MPADRQREEDEGERIDEEQQRGEGEINFATSADEVVVRKPAAVLRKEKSEKVGEEAAAREKYPLCLNPDARWHLASTCFTPSYRITCCVFPNGFLQCLECTALP